MSSETLAQAEPSHTADRSWKSRLRFGVGLVVSVVIVAVIVSQIDGARVRTSLQHVPATALIGALALIGAGFAAKIARWQVMLLSVAPSVTWPVSAQTLLASVALNNVLPLRAGDVARVFAFGGVTGAPPSAVLPLMLLERLLDTTLLVAMAAAVAFPMQRFGLLPAHLEFFAPLAVVVITAMAALAAAAGPLAARLATWPNLGLRWLPTTLHAPVRATLSILAHQLRGPQAARLLCLTVLAWLCEGGMLAVLASGFGFQYPIVAGYFACALATLATLVPSAPGFVGTFHAAAIAAVLLFGAPTDDAAAFAFLAHGLLWLPLTLVGLGCFALLTRTQRTRAVISS